MIKRIELANFQSHAKTTLDIGQFTALTGPSSSGKTSLIRALSWLFYGEWDSLYPADPEKPTAVAVELLDGTKILRVRQDKNNQAMITLPGQQPRKFKDFGEFVPGIFELLNLREIEMGDKSVNLNFSNQDDPAFLVNTKAWSKPARAQWLGRLYGAHVVNTMLRLMSKDKLETEKAVKTSETALAGLQERAKAYSDLAAREAAADVAEASQRDLAILFTIVGSLERFRSKVNLLKSKKWLYTVDANAVRDSLQQLDSMHEIRSAKHKLEDLYARIQNKSSLGAIDTAGLKASLVRYTRLKDVRSEVIFFDGLVAKIRGKAWLGKVSPVAIKGDITRLEDLRRLKALSEKCARSSDRVAALAWVSKIDPKSILPIAQAWAHLSATRGKKLEVDNKYVDAMAKLVAAENNLETRRVQIQAALFAKGKCPLCSNSTDISAAEATEHLKHLMGAGK